MPPSSARVPENLPEGPGVYMFRNARGKILYIGKARSLKKRVATYFHRSVDEPKTRAMLAEQSALETIETRTELEALLLENTLIKRHRPRFNICLRDDKTYPYIKITTGEAWPRALVTRRVLDDGHRYFGPFWGGLARRTMLILTRHFQIRTCSIEIDGRLPRPCLYFDLHACLGPCVSGLTNKDAYDAAVADVLLFLQGRNEELERSLQAKMESAAVSENFEMAAAYRDALRTARELAERQVVQRMSGENVDAWGVYHDGGDVAVQMMVVRGGAIVDRREFFFERVETFDAAEFLSSLLPQFYSNTTFLPDEVHLPVDLAEPDLIEEFLGVRKGSRVELKFPKRGSSRDRLDLAESNARSRHENRFRRVRTEEDESVERLAGILGLAAPPKRIEGFDISHIQGTDSYASLVVFENGRPHRADYRLYRIAAQSLLHPDDFASMAEAVGRRYRRLRDEGKPMPDLVLVDGGRGQLSAALGALDRLGLSIPLAGLAKREELIFRPDSPDPIRLSRRDSALRLVQRVRDEAHRFAITRHRNTRSRRAITSGLQAIEGIGPARAKRLLREFGSVEGLRSRSAEEVSRVVGPIVARRILSQLQAEG